MGDLQYSFVRVDDDPMLICGHISGSLNDQVNENKHCLEHIISIEKSSINCEPYPHCFDLTVMIQITYFPTFVEL